MNPDPRRKTAYAATKTKVANRHLLESVRSQREKPETSTAPSPLRALPDSPVLGCSVMFEEFGGTCRKVFTISLNQPLSCFSSGRKTIYE
jgi:hypothetical protein